MNNIQLHMPKLGEHDFAHEGAVLRDTRTAIEYQGPTRHAQREL